jgi:hypothetical protein
MNSKYIVDASILTAYQSCRRKYRLQTDQWRAGKWRPRTLLDHVLRWGMEELCRRPDHISDVASDAEAMLMERAANPGMDVAQGINPYNLAKDYCSMVHTILRSQYRSLQPKVPKLHAVPAIAVSTSCAWQPTTLQDEQGFLHRWTFWDAFSDAHLSRELHSWFVFGDVAVVRAPMKLHVVVVGRASREGRQESSWARGYHLPMMPGLRVRFRRRGSRGEGRSFDPAWKPLYLSEQSLDRETWVNKWVDQMWTDQEAQRLTRNLNVSKVSSEVSIDTQRQIAEEAEQMILMDLKQLPYYRIPMSRGACDGLVPCPFLDLCHRAMPLSDPMDAGYRRGNKLDRMQEWKRNRNMDTEPELELDAEPTSASV